MSQGESSTQRQWDRTTHHGRRPSQLQFGLTFDLALPCNANFDPETSYPPAEESFTLWEVYRALAAARYPTAITDCYHNRRIYSESARATLSEHDYFYEQQRFAYWCLEELEYRICEDNVEEEVGAFPVKLKTPITGEEQIVRGYPALMDVLGRVYRQAGEEIFLHKEYDLQVHVGQTNEGFGLREMKRIATLSLFVEEMFLWPLTGPPRRRKFCTLNRDTSIAVNDPASSNSSYSMHNDREARVDLPLDRGIFDFFGDSVQNIWSCSDLEELENMVEDGPIRRPPAVRVRSHDPRGYTFVFKHSQSTFRTSFIEKWLVLILSIGKATIFPPEHFKRVVVELMSLYEWMRPSDSRPSRPEVVQRALDRFGRVMGEYWDVKVRGRDWVGELEAYRDGVNSEMEEDGWAIH
ncbi:hypothetical protein CC79DRAFT_1372438 [Sarocladium strictum]